MCESCNPVCPGQKHLHWLSSSMPVQGQDCSQATGRAAEAPSWSRGPARPPWAPTSGKWLCTPTPVSHTCPTDLHGTYEMPLEFLHSECLSCWKKYIKKSVKEDFLKQTEFSFLCENLNSVSHRMWLTFFTIKICLPLSPGLKRWKYINVQWCKTTTRAGQICHLNVFLTCVPNNFWY